ncbi:LysR family transcriptional regulator [Viridibacterium curvum]|uniref:LysR family transcriptional regulator n=1 Tax=Viridibacterium curvum TaxID=1101404 RepID=A0ABP9QSG3_9RHOO
MTSLQDSEIFERNAEPGSLSAAARALDITPAAASATLKRLEARLQVPLFVRSTRSLRLTRDGEHFLAHSKPALDALREAVDGLASIGHAVQGPLQLAAPSDLGRNLLLPWLAEFHAQHPALSFRLYLSDRMADLYSLPLDLAVRYGEPADSSLIALPLAPGNRRVLCASPDWVARHDKLKHPDDIRPHDALCYVTGPGEADVLDRWRLRRGKEQVAVRVRVAHVSNDGDVVRRWAIAGLGIAYKSRLDIAADLAAGRLVELLPSWQGEAAPLHLMCANQRLLNPAVSVLRDFIAERCRALLQ